MLERGLAGNRRMETKLDRLIDDVADLKTRTTNVEEGLAGVNRRLDRLDMRMDRIERPVESIPSAI